MNGWRGHVLAATMLLGIAGMTSTASSHPGDSDCTKKQGIDRARCERHDRMYEKCGPIKGDAHVACDREFLLANPLDCKAVGFADAKACEAETSALKACEPQQGRAFMVCVRERIKASPMGH